LFQAVGRHDPDDEGTRVDARMVVLGPRPRRVITLPSLALEK
jgi:hypothetical protein